MSLPYAQRRAEFLARIYRRRCMSLESGGQRNSDNHHRFRQPADLFGLTGFAEPEALAIGAWPRQPLGSRSFSARAIAQRDWTWPPRRTEGAREHYGADQTFDIVELEERLGDLLDGCTEVHMSVGDEPAIDILWRGSSPGCATTST